MTSSTNGSGLTPYRLERGTPQPATELQERKNTLGVQTNLLK